MHTASRLTTWPSYIHLSNVDDVEVVPFVAYDAETEGSVSAQ